MKQTDAIRQIRSLGLAGVNRTVRAARHLDALKPAFAEWQAGDIYVCKKTGDYRYRFGDLSKHITPWSRAAREVFPTPAAFAFAALVFSSDEPTEKPAAKAATKPVLRLVKPKAPSSSRADVIRIAIAGGAA